jgi:hypothetical protein
LGFEGLPATSHPWTRDREALRQRADVADNCVARTAESILAEHGAKLMLNRRPKRDGQARTPTARQCRFCGHDRRLTLVRQIVAPDRGCLVRVARSVSLR